MLKIELVCKVSNVKYTHSLLFVISGRLNEMDTTVVPLNNL